MDFNFMIGGEAGQGVQSMGYILARSMAKGGYSVLASQDYESRVRGGHNFFAVRVSDRPVQAISEEVNLLIALNEETINLHRGELTKDGLILYDGERGKRVAAEPTLVSVPFERLALERTGNRIMGNTVALGAALRLVQYDFEILSAVLRKTFGKKGLEVAEKNVDAARAGYDFVHERSPGFRHRLAPVGASRNMVINGGEAVALGALAAGCKFVSGYPMTPTTGILQYFAGQAEAFNVVFEQAEDEIAAINMVLGASYAGVRALTATSGGGFSLMVESLSLAGMTETPVVIVLGQRVGPATGLPTRTEQGELEFAIHAGHGMFPRVIFAPGTAEEAFYLTVKAFNLAERYQVPVILLTDTYLSDTYVTAEFDLSKVTVERGEFLSDEEVHALGRYMYMRHKLTPSGVSPRVIPGQAAALVVTDSDEHTEDGHITESTEVRLQMVQKRLNKMAGLRTEIGTPHAYGPEEAETVLVCWGSTYGVLREAVDRLNSANTVVRMIQMSEIWPFPRKAFMDAIKGFHRLIVVEGNATGQMAHLIRAETGVDATGKILRYDGRPLTPTYVITRFHEEVEA
ncbi:MAG: 2-oxoacid:acceptor oxidoreductase subunit alpha [Candidatus Bathyarchaeota archaeon]|nr:2-oxoacid:acceptor oxidoreductase subunit alpha [Candidatus Bathyarchaeota archaeon]